MLLKLFLCSWSVQLIGAYRPDGYYNAAYFNAPHSYTTSTPKPGCNCTIPPYPKNGFHFLTESPNANIENKPGDEVLFYTVQFVCDTGHTLLKDLNYQKCTQDGIITGATDVTQCLPFCKESESDNRILSCGSENHECINRNICKYFTPPLTFAVAETTALEDEECGIAASARLTRAVDEEDQAGGSLVSGGRYASENELPWHAGIYTKTTRPYMQICGGSLVSKTVVISAAHCFWSESQKQLPASNYAVAVGKLYRPWNDPHDANAQKSDISEIKIPKYFRGHATNLQDDIALLIVASPFVYTDSVTPACLDFNLDNDDVELGAGRLGKVAGWGLTSADGQPSPILKLADLPVVELDQCFEQSDPAFSAHITSDKICAGYKQNGTAVCKGDSGGGFYIQRPKSSAASGQYILRGIVSGAPQSNHLCNTLAWASFTHVLSHQRFIRENVPEFRVANKRKQK